MSTDNDIEAITRSRLRSMRQSAGWSLDELAARSHLSASTISRIETGKRTISLDVLLALAHALQADIGSLLDVRRDDDDVVIRPVPSNRGGSTVWPLSKPSSRTAVTKMRLEPTALPREIKVHPGDDWFYVLSGRVRLRLGDREIDVDAGEAAEFSTMTPHAFDAIGEPAELIMVFDAESRRAHIHTDEG